MSSFFASFLTFHGKNFLLQIGDAPVLCGVLGSPGGVLSGRRLEDRNSPSSSLGAGLPPCTLDTSAGSAGQAGGLILQKTLPPLSYLSPLPRLRCVQMWSGHKSPFVLRHDQFVGHTSLSSYNIEEVSSHLLPSWECFR